MGTNLTQSEISSLQLDGFILQDGIPLKNSATVIVAEVACDKDPVTLKSDCLENPSYVAFFLHDMLLKFKLGRSNSPVISFLTQIHPS